MAEKQNITFLVAGTHILPTILHVGQDMLKKQLASPPSPTGTTPTPTAYEKLVLQPVIQWFGSNDRRLRLALLDHLGTFVERLPSTAINQKVFPSMVKFHVDRLVWMRMTLNDWSDMARYLEVFDKVSMIDVREDEIWWIDLRCR